MVPYMLVLVTLLPNALLNRLLEVQYIAFWSSHADKV